ncbi:MAG: hypothetical protein Q8R37_00800 [Nanoarchaeota archaeon]|nr:hypothetical protein [Nanoarchaeota archaeon]
MAGELVGTDLKELIRDQKDIYASGMRKKINDDLNHRPILIVDNPDLNKVLIMSLKSAPVMEMNKTVKSEKFFPSNRRIVPFNPYQYYIVIGEESDLDYPISNAGPNNGVLPMALIEHEVFNPIAKTGVCVPGDQITEVMRTALSSKVHDAHPSGSRPRALQTILITNPPPAERLSKENYPEVKIYVLERTTPYGDDLTVNALTGTKKNPAYYASDLTLWDGYQKSLKHLLREGKAKGSSRKKMVTIDDKITAAISAFLAGQRVNYIGHSIIDVVTVPFERPDGNKNYARYDPEYIKPLFDQAEKLRATMSKL